MRPTVHGSFKKYIESGHCLLFCPEFCGEFPLAHHTGACDGGRASGGLIIREVALSVSQLLL